jgi:hypothetical protein
MRLNKHFVFSTLTSLLIGLFVALTEAYAEHPNVTIRDVDISIDGGVYLLQADIDYVLSKSVKEALHNGVSLVFSLEIELLEYHDWWLNSDVANLEQRYRLQYHALSRKYVLENINTKVQETFSDLRATLQHLGRIVKLPLIDSTLLDVGSTYFFQIKASLDVDELPLPLRVRAYLFSDWSLSSNWHTQWLP